MNYHSVADFRVDHADFLEPVLTESVAALMAEDLVDLNRVAQDGVRVRASAGASSFRRKKTLEKCLKEAEEQVETLRKELEEDPGLHSMRSASLRLAAAQAT